MKYSNRVARRAAGLTIAMASILWPANSSKAQLDGAPSTMQTMDGNSSEAVQSETPSAANPDPFANESFRPLIIVRNATVQLTPVRAEPFYEMLGLRMRYGLIPSPQSSAPQTPWSGESLGMSPESLAAALAGDESADDGGTGILAAARSWCGTATAEMQETRGAAAVGQTGEALTTDAVQERCSQLLDLEVGVAAVDDAACQQGDVCTVNVHLALRRFIVGFDPRASASDGHVSYVWRPDPAFGEGGVHTYDEAITIIRPPVPSIRLFGNDLTRDFNAYGLAARGAALAAQRALQEVPQLQTRALVASVADGNARFCGSAADVVLDTPFYVRYQSADGPRDAGFVVARDLSDGCSMTSSLQERETTSGRPADLRPSSAQMLLGTDAIRPGMTLWQMPSVGLNFVTALGVAPSIMTGLTTIGGPVANFFQPTLTLGAEYNFGRYMGASETWLAFNVELGADLGYENSTTFYGSTPVARPNLSFAVRPEVGVLKRFFTGGNFFAELGAYVHYSISAPLGAPPGAPPGFNYGLPMTAGGRLELGVGWQLSPTTQFRIDVGGRGGFAWASTGQLGAASGLEFGPVVKLGISNAF